MDKNEINLTLAEVVRMMNVVADQVILADATEKYKAVVYIADGGTIFGKFLAGRLELPYYQITIKYRDENNNIKTRPRTKGISNVLNLGVPILLVDDIVDSGTTIRHFEKATNYVANIEYDIAALHWCQTASPDLAPTFYHSIKSESDWIVYPWERDVGYDELWDFIMTPQTDHQVSSVEKYY